MAIQELTINDLHAGVLSDETVQAQGASVMVGLDMTSKDGYLGANQKPIAMSEAAAANNISDWVLWIAYFGTEQWAYGINGRLYKLVTGVWTLQQTNSNSSSGGGGLAEFGGNLYVASNAKLGRWTGAAWNDSLHSFTATAEGIRPMVVFAGKLCIGDNNYLATVDSAGSFTADALTLDSDLHITSLAVLGDKLYIGTSKVALTNAAFGTKPDSKMFVWDGAASTPDDAFDIQIGGVTAMAEYKNTLIVWGGVRGQIYEFNGASLDPLPSIKITDQPHIGSVGGYPYPGAVAILNNVLYWGTTKGDQVNGQPLQGVYALIQKDITKPLALAYMYDTTNGSYDNRVGALLADNAQENDLYISRHDTVSSDYGIDQLDSGAGADYLTYGYMETQRYEFPTDVHIIGIRINSELPENSASLAVSYDTDDSGTYTSAGSFTATTYQDLLYFENVNCRRLKLKFAWTPDNTNTKNFWLAGFTIYYRPMGRFYTR
jgi:hypothetical protein